MIRRQSFSFNRSNNEKPTMNFQWFRNFYQDIRQPNEWSIYFPPKTAKVILGDIPFQDGENNYFCSGTAQKLFSIIRRIDL